MTVKATVDSTLNSQSAEIVVVEKPPHSDPTYERATLSGGTETFIFTELDGGADKEYSVKIVPSTSDPTQTAQVNYGAEVKIDPIPHRDADASERIREDANFENGVGGRELGLGDNPLVGGLLTSALNDGEVLADDGYVYSTVQAAQDAASSWIFVGPGTFSEKLTVDTNGMMVYGSGHNTTIDGGDNRAVEITANNVTLSKFSATQNTGAGLPNIEFQDSYSGHLVDSIHVPNCDVQGIRMTSSDSLITNCHIVDPGHTGIEINFNPNVVISDCLVENAGQFGYSVSDDDNILTNCITINSSNNGVSVDGNDNIIIGNRIIGSNNEGIDIQSGPTDNIIANNRVSDSSGNDLDDSGTNTLFDSNNTGAAN